MLTPLIFLALFLSCLGQESTSAQPATSTTPTPSRNTPERDGPRSQPPQVPNSRTQRTFAQPAAGSAQSSPDNQPRVVPSSNQPRRTGALTGPAELRNPLYANQPNRENVTPYEPALRSLPLTSRSQQPRQEDQPQGLRQPEYFYRPETAGHQADRSQRTGQPESRSSPVTALRRAEPAQGTGQLGYRYLPETSYSQDDSIRGSGQQDNRLRPETTLRQAEPSQDPAQPSFRYRHDSVATQPRRIPSPVQTGYQARQPYTPEEISYKPYSFNYVSEAEDGYYSHQQSADDTGKVIGSYSFVLDDGRKRVVEYIADQNGFRANIDTNEPGTSSEVNPADVVYYSTGPSPAIPVSRGYESPRRDSSSRAQGVDAPAYPQRRPIAVRRPEVVTYHGFNADTGNTVTGYQDSEIESGPVRPAIRNYQGQITRESSARDGQGRRPESRANDISSYQPVDTSRESARPAVQGYQGQISREAGVRNVQGRRSESQSPGTTNYYQPLDTERDPAAPDAQNYQGQIGRETGVRDVQGRRSESQAPGATSYYQPLNTERDPAAPGSRNYQGQIGRESGARRVQGRGFEARAPDAASYQPLDIERGPAYTSFLRSSGDARVPSYGFGYPGEPSPQADANARGLELSGRPAVAPLDSSRSNRGYGNQDTQAPGLQLSQPQYPNLRSQPSSNEENVAVPDYQAAQPAPHSYNIDDGNYWNRRY